MKSGAGALKTSGFFDILLGIFLFFLSIFFFTISLVSTLIVTEPENATFLTELNNGFSQFIGSFYNLSATGAMSYIALSSIVCALILLISTALLILGIKSFKIADCSPSFYATKRGTVFAYFIFTFLFFVIFGALSYIIYTKNISIITIIVLLFISFLAIISSLLKLVCSLIIKKTSAPKINLSHNSAAIVDKSSQQNNTAPAISAKQALSDELSKLVELKSLGVIDAEEYELRKRNLEVKFESEGLTSSPHASIKIASSKK